MKYLTSEIADLYNEVSKIQNTDELAQRLQEFTLQRSTLQYIWLFRDYYRHLEEKHMEEYPILYVARALISACEGDLKKAEEYTKKIEDNTPIRILSGILMPYTTTEQLFNFAKSLHNIDLNTIPKITLTAGRPTIINGYRDFTPYFTEESDKQEHILQLMNNLYGKKHGDVISKIINAEILYQQDKLYDALLEVVNVIPRLIEAEDFRILFVALFLQIEILLMSGEITSTALKMEEIKQKIRDKKDEVYLPNLAAVEAWAAMYDGDTERVRYWLAEEAPDDTDEFTMLNLFQYMVKMRGYIIEGHHLALLSLASRLLPILVEGHRYMDVCEIYILLAMNAHDTDKTESAFEYLEKAIELAKKYCYDRLIADEGQRMYNLLAEYKAKKGTDEYIGRLIKMSYKVAAANPKYLQVPKVILTEKEICILRYLNTRLKTQEIADELGLSIETVKTHKKNIFKKFGVKTKAQAVTIGKLQEYI